MLEVTDAWRVEYPEAAVGLLAMRGASNPKHHQVLNQKKEDLQQDLRTRFTGANRSSLKALPTVEAYSNYYKRFKKTYHVLLQLESVALKGKSIPRVAALVEAMFMAELKNQLLTAGHDLALVQEPVRVDVAQGDERYIRLNDQEQVLKAGDMYIADTQGILSSIIYGPDRRTQISSSTQDVLFTVYAPSGIPEERVTQHLQDIQGYVHTVAPEAETIVLGVYGSH
jgi:DNA/RNA-binding domain of Phe-tRNA-synthetase-like protein